MDSRRLPGKVLADLGGRPLMEWVIARASTVKGVAEIAVATTDRAIDDPIAAFANAVGIRVHRGECDDVVARVLGCARKIEAEWFFRLNGDSPFPDPALLAAAVDNLYCTEIHADLFTNLGDRHFPYGIAVELLRTAALAESAAVPPADSCTREHLTHGIYCHPECFHIAQISQPDDPMKHARLVVDTAEDLYRLQKLVAALGSEAASADWRTLAEAYLRHWPATSISVHSPV